MERPRRRHISTRTALWAAAALLLLTLTVLYLPGLVAQTPPSAAAAPTVKHIIVLIADGCGYNHIAATDYYLAGRTGVLLQEQFPVRYAMSTYPAGSGYDPQQAWADFGYVRGGATDSAAAATALSTGCKTKNGMLGVDADGHEVTHAMEVAERRGLSSGVVTSVPFAHATPAGFVVHLASRAEPPAAEAMLYDSAADVVIGAGHPYYDGDARRRKTPQFAHISPDTWRKVQAGVPGRDANGDGTPDRWTFVDDTNKLRALGSSAAPKRLFGLVRVADTLQQERSGSELAPPGVVPPTPGVPSLAELAAAALNVLDDNPRGFMLMVEGGAVDWAAHGHQPGRLIEEVIAFSGAVEEVCRWVERESNWDETLVIVTGDHETGYIVGPGSDPVWQPLGNNGAGWMPAVTFQSTGHTNSLIPLFARGAAAQQLAAYADEEDPVRGKYLDNTEVAKAIIALLQ